MQYASSTLRKFLKVGFTADDLYDFCTDHKEFKDICDDITSQTKKAEIIRLILARIERQEIEDILLGWAKEENPGKFDKFFPNYTSANTIFAAESEQVLRQILLKLNYHQQDLLFKQFIHQNQTGAFLIHGDPEYGQRWLLNRLLGNVPYNTASKKIEMPLGFSRSQAGGSRAFWQRLSGSYLDMPHLTSPREIAQEFYKVWQNNNVIFIFKDVDRTSEAHIQELLDDFWFNLVRKPPPGQHHLLMFFVDEYGEPGLDGFDLIHFFDQMAETDPAPFARLPIANITRDDLISWIQHEFATLPTSITLAMDQIVDEILHRSEGGIPELVFSHICKICKHNWYNWS